MAGVLKEKNLSVTTTVIVGCWLLLSLGLAAGCTSKPVLRDEEAEQGQPAKPSKEAATASNLSPGDQFTLTLDCSYVWKGEGGEIRWQADPSNKKVELTARITELTRTCYLGGEATLPVLVSTAVPEGSMTGSGKRKVDVGGPCENGLAKLTIMETTGGKYTISAGGRSLTASTPENVIKYDMVFNLTELVKTGKSQATATTENGTSTGTLEPVVPLVPLVPSK